MDEPSQPHAYRAFFFDLDGTLLNMDLDEFLSAYYADVARYAIEHGFEPSAFKQGFKNGVKAMVSPKDITNCQAFWNEFTQATGEPTDTCVAVFTEYYNTDFKKIGAKVQPNIPMQRALATLAEKGYPLMLTTMPLFPIDAVAARLAWAGIDANLFKFVTTYDTSTSVKPHLDYYRQALDTVGAHGEDIIMVGNNTQEDLAAMKLGLDAYLVTDFMIDPEGYDLSTVRHGTMEEFETWTTTLPTCENPLS